MLQSLRKFKVLKGIPIALLVQKVRRWWSFSGEWSASTACAAGLFCHFLIFKQQGIDTTKLWNHWTLYKRSQMCCTQVLVLWVSNICFKPSYLQLRFWGLMSCSDWAGYLWKNVSSFTNRPRVAGAVLQPPLLLINSSQTWRARELQFWENVPSLPCVKCQVSHVMCQVSRVKCHIYKKKNYEGVDLVGGGSIIIEGA